MAILCWLFLADLFLISSLGCGSRDSPRPDAAVGNLAGRLTAAKGIHDVDEKDKALGSVARDAADAGDIAIAEQAIAAMHDVDEKDKAAYSAALRLAKAGKTEAAAATAKVIHDVDLKDKVLAKIAKGDTRD
jgi:hypothetical protein